MTWQKAYENLDPHKPLLCTNPWYRAQLYGDFLKNIKDRLVLGRNSNAKLLLSGHIGSGKSTMLNAVACEPEIERDFLVVRCSIKDFTEPEETDCVDVLLALAVRTIDTANDAHVKFDAGLEKRIRDLALELAGQLVREQVTEAERKAKAEAEVGAGIPGILKFLKFGFAASYSVQRESRDTIRKYFKPRLADLLRSIDALLDSIKANLGGKDILILVDDTDKPFQDAARELFLGNGDQLARPHASIVYVVDTSVSCFKEFSAIRGKFGEEEFFPGVTARRKDGSEDEAKVKILMDLIRARAPAEIIPDKQLRDLVLASGGIVRELVRLCREAVFIARGTVTNDHVAMAQVHVRNSFNFLEMHIRMLKEILKNPLWRQSTPEEEEAFFFLLRQPALFQYRNGEDKWLRPYPIFIPWLEKLNTPRIQKPN